MSGDSVLRLYVYGLVLALLVWAVLVSWLVTRAAWRMVRSRTLAVGRAPHVDPRPSRSGTSRGALVGSREP